MTEIVQNDEPGNYISQVMTEKMIKMVAASSCQSFQLSKDLVAPMQMNVTLTRE